MASTFEKTNPIKRDHVIEGYAVKMVIDGEGITFTRKGDKHRDKASVKVSWTDIAEIGAERSGVSFYAHLGFE